MAHDVNRTLCEQVPTESSGPVAVSNYYVNGEQVSVTTFTKVRELEAEVERLLALAVHAAGCAFNLTWEEPEPKPCNCNLTEIQEAHGVEVAQIRERCKTYLEGASGHYTALAEDILEILEGPERGPN